MVFGDGDEGTASKPCEVKLGIDLPGKQAVRRSFAEETAATIAAERYSKAAAIRAEACYMYVLTQRAAFSAYGK